MNLNCLITSNQHTLSGVYSTQWGDFKVLAWLGKSICSDFAFLCKFCNWLGCIYLGLLACSSPFEWFCVQGAKSNETISKTTKTKRVFYGFNLDQNKRSQFSHLYPSSKTLLKVYYGSSVYSLSGVQHLWSFEYASTGLLVIFSIDDFAIEKNSFKLSDKNIPLL